MGFSASSRSAKFIYLFIFVSDYGRNLLHRHITLNLITILSMKLSNYGRDFLHRHVVLNLFIYLFL